MGTINSINQYNSTIMKAFIKICYHCNGYTTDRVKLITDYQLSKSARRDKVHTMLVLMPGYNVKKH